MVGVFADQHMSQKARPRAAAFDRARRQWDLDEAFAAGAGQPGPHDPIHDEAPGDILQFLGHILADPAQAAAAIGASLGTGAEFNLHPGDVVRDRATLGFVLLFDVRQAHPRGHRGGGDLAGLKGKLKLFCCLR